jgi:predicted ATPase
MQEALTFAQDIAHPYSLSFALSSRAWVATYRREEAHAVQEQAEAAIASATEYGFPFQAAFGTMLHGAALAEQGQGETGLAQIRQGLTAYWGTGARLAQTYWLARLIEACGRVGQIEEAFTVLAESLELAAATGEHFYEAELYRLKGELTLQLKVESQKSKIEEAEECFLKAIDIARKQQAKSLELRAVMSLAQLWQRQGKTAEARQRLAEIYGWFTEGFDTKDLQEAKALLVELSP